MFCASVRTNSLNTPAYFASELKLCSQFIFCCFHASLSLSLPLSFSLVQSCDKCVHKHGQKLAATIDRTTRKKPVRELYDNKKPFYYCRECGRYRDSRTHWYVVRGRLSSYRHSGAIGKWQTQLILISFGI